MPQKHDVIIIKRFFFHYVRVISTSWRFSLWLSSVHWSLFLLPCCNQASLFYMCGFMRKSDNMQQYLIFIYIIFLCYVKVCYHPPAFMQLKSWNKGNLKTSQNVSEVFWCKTCRVDKNGNRLDEEMMTRNNSFWKFC